MGFLSNRYTYEPYGRADHWVGDVLGPLGGYAGEAIGAAQLGPLGAVIGEKVGEAAGQQLGLVLDEHETIISNAETFLKEINDWRSWADVMMRSNYNFQ